MNIKTGIPSLIDQIAQGVKSYHDHCELCLLEELPEWVRDIRMALHNGTISYFDGRGYEPWVIGAYCIIKFKGNKPAKSDSR